MIQTEELDTREFFKVKKFSEIPVQNNAQEKTNGCSDGKCNPNKEINRSMTDPVKAKGGKHYPKKKATMNNIYPLANFGQKSKIGQSLLQPNDKIANSLNITHDSY